MATKMVLEEAVRDGKLDVVENLLKANPSVVADFKLASLGESLLDIAIKSGHLNIVRKLMEIDPYAALELNNDGFRPLDVAVITGNFGIVKEIMRFDQHLCLLKGKDQRTPLHYAAMKGRINVTDEFLNSCPDCVEDVTVDGDTALHLAVKCHQFDAFTSLIKWLNILNKETMINIGDEDGNTILHIAVTTKQKECIQVLLAENSTNRRTIDVNAKNNNGLTPLDLLDIQDSYGVRIKQKLEDGGAIRSNDVNIIESEDPKKWFKYFKFQKQRDSPSETRSALLVVAALIATVCFQAGFEPPNAIFDNPPQPKQNPNYPPPPSFAPGGVSFISAASAALGSHATSYLFLFANSLGLTASTSIIIYLTAGFPFQRELQIALYSMMFTYGFAISAIIKDIDDTERKALASVLITIAFVLPFALRWLPMWGKRAWKYCRKIYVLKSTLPIDK